MSDEEALKFIKEEINQRISSYQKRTDYYRKGTIWLTMLLAILSAVTTVLIGLGQIYDWQPLSIIALIISASMTVINAWDGLLNYRSRWVSNNEALMKLYELKSDIEYQNSKKLLPRETSDGFYQNLDKFYQRYKEILQAANESWKTDRLQQEHKNEFS